MKRRGSLVALGLAAAVVAALVYWDARRPTTDEANRARQHILPGFERANATEVEVERRNTPATKLRHEASGWWIVSGDKRLRADDSAVDSLLAVLEYGEVERRIDHADATLRATLGVNAPNVIVRVEGHTLRIGNDDPSRGVYVARDDEPGVIVAERRLIETADIDPRLWLSMRLTIADPAEAKEISTAGTTLTRDGVWRVTVPVIVRASDAKVDALLQQLERTRADHVDHIDNTLGVTRFILSLDGAAQARIGGQCGREPANGLFADRTDGATLCFRASDFDLLRASIATFYERRLFPLRLDDVVAVDVGPLQLRRESAAWRITAPLAAVRPVDDAKVRALLEPLLAAAASSFSFEPVPSIVATRVRIATRDEEIVAAVDGAGAKARRAGETLTLELAAPLTLATSF